MGAPLLLSQCPTVLLVLKLSVLLRALAGELKSLGASSEHLAAGEGVAAAVLLRELKGKRQARGATGHGAPPSLPCSGW